MWMKSSFHNVEHFWVFFFPNHIISDYKLCTFSQPSTNLRLLNMGEAIFMHLKMNYMSMIYNKMISPLTLDGTYVPRPI
jgi:hypothetical protein